MSTEIRLRRGTASQWTLANPVLGPGEAGFETDTGKLKIGDGTTSWTSLEYVIGNLADSNLNDLGDVVITDAVNGDFLRWNGSQWINDAVNLSTDTIGDYVERVSASTGVTVSGSGGEAASISISIGQDVATTASVTFAHVSADVTGDLIGNADTASTLETPRTITISGEASGSVSFDGSQDVDISVSIQPDSVELGTDTTGNYMVDAIGGTGVTVSHTPSEGSSASISIGQDVATSSSPTFAAVNVVTPVGSGFQTASVSGGGITFDGTVELGHKTRLTRYYPTSDNTITLPNASGTVALSSASTGIVALGTDTTGNYVNDIVSGTGVTITHTPGEGSSASIAIGQPVGTTDNVTFNNIEASGNITLLTGGLITSTPEDANNGGDITISPNGIMAGSASTGGSINILGGYAYGSNTVGGNVNIDAGDGMPTNGSISIGGEYAEAISIGRNSINTTVNGNLTVSGDLTVSGSVTAINTENLLVEDNIVTLNSNVTGEPNTNAGIEVERGDSPNVTLRWNESTDSWEVTEDGTNYKNIAVGQDVETSSSVTFAAVTAPLFGNADTASALQTARIIELSGDVSGSVSFDGSSSVSISASIQPNSVELGTDTTGNYMTDVVAGTGVIITHTASEGSSASIAIGQDVSSSAEVTFSRLDIDGTKIAFQGPYPTTLNARTQTDIRDIYIPDASGTIALTSGSTGVVTLGTDTTGNYMSDVVAGENIVIDHTPGEGSSASIRLSYNVTGQDFTAYSHITTPQIISLSEPNAASVQFRTPSENRTIYIPDANGTLAVASASTGIVALGADTTGNYVENFFSSPGIIVTHTPGEGSTASIGLNADLNDLNDTTVVDPVAGEILYRDGQTNQWINMALPTAEPMGHEDKTQSTISFNNSTRTFSIAPVSSTFTIWNSGVRYIKESTETVQIPNTSGLYYIYYDNSGSLQYRTSYFDWDDDAPTAYIYWNATASTAYFFADERHGVTLDWATHEYLHRTRGAVIADGFGASNFVTNGDGSSDTHAKLDIASGTFFDEDLEVNITHSASPTANTWEQVLEGNAEIPVFYHSGSEWVKDVATEFPFKVDGSNVPVYNSYSGSWSTTAITNNKFFISWIVATNNLNEPIIAVLGQASYNTIGAAEEATWDDINLDGFPVFEFRPLHKVIFQYSTGYTNTYKVAIRQVYDLRRVSSSGSAIPTTPVSDHGSLTGLGDDDHSQYVHTSVARTITANHTFSNGLTAASVSITGTPTNATDAVTKQYVDAAIAGLHWHESVRLATNAVLPNSPTYSNGTNGQDATLTAGENARLLIDSTNANDGDRILVKNQASGLQNGIYRVINQGGPSSPWSIMRTEDFDGAELGGNEIYAGEAVYVTAGTVNIRQGFVVSSTGTGTNGAHIVGTDSITFTQFAGTAAFSAGDGLVQDGNTLNVATANSGRIVVNANDIDLATVEQSNTSGSDGISFVQSHSVDSYGRITGTVTANVQNASTSQKGIAQFNSSNFTVSSGSVSIANDGIILGTHTTGNYLREIVAGPGLMVIHTPGEGSTASIELDPVITSSSAGASGINFISSITTDGTGRITSYTASDVQDARLSNEMGITKGIASFDYQNFTASSGVISIANNGITLGTHTTGDYVSNISAGTGVNITGGTGESSSVTIDIGQAVNTAASVTFARLSLTSDASFNDGRILISRTGFGTGPGDYSAKIVFDANGTQEQFILRHNDYYGAETADIILRNSTGTDTATGIRLVADTSSVGITVGPRLEVGSVSNLTAPYSTTSSSVVLTVYRSSPACVGVKITDTASSSTNLFEWADSLGVVVGSISGYSDGYRFNATTASIGSLNVGGNLVIGGDLTVNGTTTTVNSTTITVDDPIITLGGDTAPSSDDNKDRGIEFRYHSGTAASVGFMGYDDSTGRFVFLTGATNTSEVFSGANASVQVGSLHVTDNSALEYVTLSSDASEARVRADYAGFGQFIEMYSSMGGQFLHWGNGATTASIQFSSGANAFTFSKPINSASLSSASINAPILSGSVHYDSSASVTLPSKTFFPEEYLTVSSSVTLNATTHRYATLEMTASAGTSVITVPADASSNFPIGSVIQIIRVGAGEVQVTASAGVTVNNAVGARLRAQWSTATLRKRAANTWLLSGDLKV